MITVHHHHKPHVAPIGSYSAATVTSAAAAAATATSKHQQAASNVEVKYLAHYFCRDNTAAAKVSPPPTASMTNASNQQTEAGGRFHDRSKSLQLNSNNHYHYRQAAVIDMNNNMPPTATIGAGGKQPVDSLIVGKDDAQSAQTNATTKPSTELNGGQQQERTFRHHSRSTSLVINPNFLGSNSHTSPVASPRRRRSLPRRQRNPNLAQFSLESLGTGNGSANSTETPTETPLPTDECAPEAAAIATEVAAAAAEHTEPATTTGKSTPESLEQFRQAGAMLREISDNFSKYRRRTI